MNDIQKCKTKFRSSKVWKLFKHKISVKQHGLDYITHSKLRKYSALHHCDLNPDRYSDVSTEDNFVYLNNGCHDVVHYMYTYYRKDPTCLDRLKEVLDRMVQLNG